ncbi:hypothetical protein [Kitasatospora cheerisanensis]|uniref:hypothetical protein n=1 Tax=Kitasatospora cheerisanensis TaxID=81942 RepID=UPI000559F749|nr:hypothetical protein [Kitasatospora cheerisanensis]
MAGARPHSPQKPSSSISPSQPGRPQGRAAVADGLWAPVPPTVLAAPVVPVVLVPAGARPHSVQ